MLDNKKKLLLSSKKKVKELLKRIEETAIKNLEKALNSGSISEESEFLHDNYLLPSTVILDSIQVNNIELRDKVYKKESDNIRLFL